MDYILIRVSFIIVLLHGGSSAKVRLSDISTLTFTDGMYTTGRRSPPIPQLKCIGGSAQGKHIPKTVQCYNRGTDGFDVQWECKAEMPGNFKFGKVEVVCEGYDYPEDPFVLRGSCGLEYELEHAGTSIKSSYPSPWSVVSKNEWFSLSSLVTVCFIILVVYIIYLSCYQPRDGFEGDRFRGHRSFWHGDSRPPPSSSPYPPGWKTDRNYYNGPPTYDEACGSGSASYSSSSGPGFWSGLGIGSLAGYLFGSNQNRSGGRYGRQFDRGFAAYTDYNEEPSTSWRSSESVDTETRTTTGYGGTRRR